MAKLSGYKNPQDPLPRLTGTKFESGTYRGAYSQIEMGTPRGYSVIGQKLDRTDGPDPFVRTASKDSFESSGVVGSGPVPATGNVDDGR